MVSEAIAPQDAVHNYQPRRKEARFKFVALTRWRVWIWNATGFPPRTEMLILLSKSPASFGPRTTSGSKIRDRSRSTWWYNIDTVDRYAWVFEKSFLQESFFVVVACHYPILGGFDWHYQAVLSMYFINFEIKKFGTAKIKPGAAGWEASMLHLCCAAPVLWEDFAAHGTVSQPGTGSANEVSTK